jgi:hypothetical protein
MLNVHHVSFMMMVIAEAKRKEKKTSICIDESKTWMLQHGEEYI